MANDEPSSPPAPRRPLRLPRRSRSPKARTARPRSRRPARGETPRGAADRRAAETDPEPASPAPVEPTSSPGVTPAAERGAPRPGAAAEPSRLDLAELKEMGIQKLAAVAKSPRDPGRRHHEEAGAGVPDPARPGREGRAHLLRGRARDPARRLRLPARARVLLPAGPGRHLRLALADPQVRPAHRRHDQRPDPPAQGGRALLRPHQGGRRQLRAARPLEGEDLLRQPDAALSRRTGSSSRRRPTTSRRGSST